LARGAPTGSRHGRAATAHAGGPDPPGRKSGRPQPRGTRIWPRRV